MTTGGKTSGRGTRNTARQTPRAGSVSRSAASRSNTRATPRSAARATRTTRATRGLRVKDPRKLMRLIPMLVIPALLITMLLLVKQAEGKEGGFSLPSLSTLKESVTESAAKGVSIEGVDVSAMERAQAEAEIKSKAALLLSEIDLTVGEGENELRMTAAFIDAATDMDTLLARVYDQGASGTFSLTVSANEDTLRERLTAISEQVGTPAIEPYAEARLNENNVQRFTIHEGSDGTAMDIDATVAQIQAALAARDLQARIAPALKTVAPTMTVDYIKDNTKRIASYTTRYRDSESNETIANRVFNIEKAAETINCVIVPPDEVWSFNDHVGKRTVEGGWKEANGISGGKEYTLQAGGGICQVSTTLYNALLRANIEVTDRKAHSIPSDYVDKGLDATVDSGGIDLKFRNDTGAPVYIFAYTRPDPDNDRYSNITVSLYGKPLPEGVKYELRSEIVETNERTDTRFTYSEDIPEGYELTKVTRHDGYTAEVYRDKYVDGTKEDSVLLYTDKYRGNVAEIAIGTGPSTLTPPKGAVKGGSPVEDAG